MNESLEARIPSTSLLDQFDPELIQQLRRKICQSDWDALQGHLAEERKLDRIKKTVLDKFQKAQTQLENEWERLNVQEQSKLVGEMQEHLYDLQLVEHSLKVPLLEITKIMFSLNPKRCVNREESQAKQKSPKRRKNELGVLGNDLNLNEEPASSTGRSFPIREAKLLAVSQVHQHHQDEQLLDELSSFGRKMVSAKRRTPRLSKNNNNNTNTPSIGMSPIGIRSPTQNDGLTDKEEEAQQQKTEGGGEHGHEEDEDPNLAAEKRKSPTPPINGGRSVAEEILGSSPRRRTESGGNEGTSEQMLHSPPGTRSRKKGGGKEAEGCSSGGGGGRSPRKRRGSTSGGTESRPRNGSGNGKDCEEDEPPIPTDEPTYCLCEQISFGEMICCDYELCSVEWFHFSCVNIKSKPKGKKWFCPLCRHNDKANMLKPDLHQKLEQIRHRTQ